MQVPGRGIMPHPDGVDMFDVATACQHIPNGHELLDNESPAVLARLGELVQGGPSLYYAYCEKVGVSLHAADELWYWFRPDHYDGDLYHDLRDEAPSTPPRA